MNWSRDKITGKVIEVADKYGNYNPQQLKQLEFTLRKCDPVEVFNGLYSVFLVKHDNFYERQQLSGVLLYSIQPKVKIDLKSTIRGCLETYNLSIEELPWYLADLYSKEIVIDAIEDIEKGHLSERAAESLRTFKWWLGGYENKHG